MYAPLVSVDLIAGSIDSYYGWNEIACVDWTILEKEIDYEQFVEFLQAKFSQESRKLRLAR